MRHRVAGRKLSADTQHRSAMRRNMARALFQNGRVFTTMAKAKAIRPYIEKLVTRARRAATLKDSDRAAYVHQLRVLRKEIPDRSVLRLLVEKIGPMCSDRPGGYTRILRDGKNQLGDNAPRAVFEFVDRPDMPDETPDKAKKKKKKKA